MIVTGDTFPLGLRVGPVTLHAITEAECVKHVITALSAGEGGWIVTVNLHHVQLFRQDSAYAQLCARASLRVADGMPLVWASRLRGTALPERVAGSHLIRSLSAAAADQGFSVYLLGGEPDTAEQAALRLRTEYPQLRVAGWSCPPPNWRSAADREREILDAVVAAKPHLVFVALSKPSQDEVIAQLSLRLPATWLVGVGITFSFVAGRLRRAPEWMQDSGLEWLHRLWQEPGRLWRRYLGMVPDLIRLFWKAGVERCVSWLNPLRAAGGSGRHR
jgi:N-acetylglucosaminyldiphosphoundecaprenol N-acetyl-beta-D-mannosaminyltransferase